MEEQTDPVEPLVEVVHSEEPVSPAFAELLHDNPALVNDVRHYFARLQADYMIRVTELEVFLGFVESSEELGVRVAKLERFVGIKG